MAPDKVKVPVPDWVTPPIVPLITPAKLLLPLKETFKVLAPKFTPVAPELLINPASVAPEVVPEISNTPVFERVKPEDVAIDPVPESAKVPALTLVAPVKVLAPNKVNVPLPVLVSELALPFSAVAKVTSLPLVSIAHD